VLSTSRPTVGSSKISTGQHYLEDIFVHVVQDSANEAFPLAQGAATP
jgi:hypothetical protein